MAHELILVDAFIYKVLTEDVQLAALIGKRVFARKAPQNATLPYIVHNIQSAGGVGALNEGQRVMGDHIWLVRGIAEGNNSAVLEPIATRIIQVLDRAGDTVLSRGVVFGSIIDRPFMMLENGEAGAPDYLHLGATFRILVQPPAG